VPEVHQPGVPSSRFVPLSAFLTPSGVFSFRTAVGLFRPTNALGVPSGRLEGRIGTPFGACPPLDSTRCRRRPEGRQLPAPHGGASSRRVRRRCADGQSPEERASPISVPRADNQARTGATFATGGTVTRACHGSPGRRLPGVFRELPELHDTRRYRSVRAGRRGLKSFKAPKGPSAFQRSLTLCYPSPIRLTRYTAHRCASVGSKPPAGGTPNCSSTADHKGRLPERTTPPEPNHLLQTWHAATGAVPAEANLCRDMLRTAPGGGLQEPAAGRAGPGGSRHFRFVAWQTAGGAVLEEASLLQRCAGLPRPLARGPANARAGPVKQKPVLLERARRSFAVPGEANLFRDVRRNCSWRRATRVCCREDPTGRDRSLLPGVRR
jgi:hypothetical protein